MRRVLGTWAECYDGTGGKLLFVEEKEGEYTVSEEVKTGGSVSFIARDTEKALLFALLEVREFGGDAGGMICQYDCSEGKPVLIKTSNSYGAYPIDMILTERYAVVLNHGSTKNWILRTERTAQGGFRTYREYDEASLVLFGRKEDGTIGDILDIYKFSGHGALPFFQESASPHSLFSHVQNVSSESEVSVESVEERCTDCTAGSEESLLCPIREETEIYVPERGTDQVSVFLIDEGVGRLKKVGILKSEKGYGPRNVVVSGDGRYVYVMHEIAPVIAVYRWEKAEDGKLRFEKIQEIGTVSAEKNDRVQYETTSFQAPHPVDMKMAEDGKLLICLTRSVDCLSVFAVGGDGRLAMRQCEKLKGVNPRQLETEGNGLLIVSLDSGTVERWDIKDGKAVWNHYLISGIPRLAVMEKRNEGERDGIFKRD